MTLRDQNPNVEWKSTRFERAHHKRIMHPVSAHHEAPSQALFISFIILKIMQLFFCLFSVLRVSSIGSRESSIPLPPLAQKHCLANRGNSRKKSAADPSPESQHLKELMDSTDSKAHSFSQFKFSGI